MALIRNAEPKSRSKGYDRLFDNCDLGYLISKLQSAVISSGSELEKIITSIVPSIPDLGEVLTGRELCELLEIDYEEIVAQRLKDGSDNLDYFCQELIKIEAVRTCLEN